MNDHLNILQKQASFDVKCSKMPMTLPSGPLIVRDFAPLPFMSILPRSK